MHESAQTVDAQSKLLARLDVGECERTHLIETVADDALLLRVLPAGRYGNPEGSIGGVLFWPPDPWRLVDDPEAVDLHLAPWVVLGARLTGMDRPDPDHVSTASMGPPIEQTPITAA